MRADDNGAENVEGDRGCIMGEWQVPTFGVEEELLLIDAVTAIPAMINTAVAARTQDVGLTVQMELTPCQIETATPVLHTAVDLVEILRSSRRVLAAAAAGEGGRIVAAGVPPLLPGTGAITDTTRYRRIAAEYGILAAEQGVCGAHVHVEVSDRATAIAVGNHLRPWLPILLALTANSAFYDGVDTGYASWRSVLWSRWPSAGPPPLLTSETHYDQTVDQMRDIGAILDDAMVYWDVRPAMRFPTVEIRISDVPATVEDTALLAVIVRALVMTAVRDIDAGTRAPEVAEHALRWAYWRAARDGLTNALVHPVTGRLASVDAATSALMEHIAPALDAAGDHSVAKLGMSRTLMRGNGATRQRRTVEEAGSVAAAVLSLAEKF
ncbi:glutamate--cysteine ligase [Rhodococcus sp. G-MC3]|uniref:carboxylate-amine ligase n=1 Tax=Rhodococcus sp. G-MC3 TaxID=3046209 RepID=UPI0024BA7743|nr:glutamate--cysteine ligase [Rhodococcus sp. G-MC3]MDJ0394226.1 glutamate--cysteine ligase [Rhodococcus sp. G-MC3]